ncbi:MAG: 5-(carboxyamino)imidazole ribonucleotide mutase [Proteobacteria bacterium]|nr:MAG: 5-(carboxyamino)imidazole ribonucleotide mutase [Pseudomonadota bacterium]
MSKVLILLGSQSDLTITEKGQEVLRDFKIPYDLRIASAHRSPAFVEELVKGFERQGGQVIVCIAGMSAHLAGVVASLTNLPVLAVPVANAATAGLDALLSMSQMPAGIPVATMTLGKAGFTNAAIFAIQVIAAQDKNLSEELKKYRAQQTSSVIESDSKNRVIFEG